MVLDFQGCLDQVNVLVVHKLEKILFAVLRLSPNKNDETAIVVGVAGRKHHGEANVNSNVKQKCAKA